MRKSLSLAILILIATTVFAQTTNAPAAADNYTVVQGDTLWGLSNAYKQNGDAWRDLIFLNPWLESRITELGNGEAHVLIRPGETISGITRAEALGETPMTVNLGAQNQPLFPPGQPRAYQTNVESFPIYDIQRDATFPWYTLILVALFGLLAYWTLRYFAKPGSAGRPVIPNGIRTDTPEHITQDVERAANRVAGRYTGDARAIRRVGPIYAATFRGTGLAGYAGQTNMPLRYFDNDRGYQSRFRFADGSEEDLNFMQICANDVVITNMRYFPAEVIRGEIVVPAPEEVRITRTEEQPAATAETTPLVPGPETPTPAAPALAAVVDINSRDSNPTTTIIAGDRRAAFTGGAEIRVNGKEVEVTFADGGRFTLSPAPVKKAKKAKKATVPAASRESIS